MGVGVGYCSVVCSWNVLGPQIFLKQGSLNSQMKGCLSRLKGRWAIQGGRRLVLKFHLGLGTGCVESWAQFLDVQEK